MSAIVLDADLEAKLGDLRKQVNVVDADGNPVGCFLPQSAYMRLLYDLAWAESSETEREEAREDYHKNGGVELSEVLTYLATLKNDGNPSR